MVAALLLCGAASQAAGPRGHPRLLGTRFEAQAVDSVGITLVPGADDEFVRRDDGDRDVIERIDEVRGGVPPGYVDHHIRVDQVPGMAVPSALPARIVPQRVYIAHAVDDVVAICPHAIEGKLCPTCHIMFDTHLKPKVFKAMIAAGLQKFPESWKKSIYEQAAEASAKALKTNRG